MGQAASSVQAKINPDNLTIPQTSFYQLSAKALDGSWIDFKKYKGKPVLVVNVASECGLTKSMYEGMLELNKRYRSKGLMILVFPCNQFFGEEPGTNAEVRGRLKKKWGLPMDGLQPFEKVHVNGPETHTVYKYLRGSNHPAVSNKRVKWNFTKFLVDAEGVVQKRWGSKVPMLTLIPEIERVISEAQYLKDTQFVDTDDAKGARFVAPAVAAAGVTEVPGVGGAGGVPSSGPVELEADAMHGGYATID